MGKAKIYAMFGCCTLVWALPPVVAAQDDDDLALAFGDKAFVSIATGARQPVTRAPAVATVITAEEIEGMGATDLDEVLESVPGLHVARSSITNDPLYVIRGVYSQFNPQVLMLENGIPVTSIFLGDRGNVWGGYPVENIARIEVIRGPGSALYGADAYSGVINIITKSAADTKGTVAGVRLGSFRTRDAWMLHGGKWGEVAVAAYFRIGGTDGSKQIVRADAQTGLDSTFGTQASRAPGPTNFGRDAVDGHINLTYGNWQARAGYKRRDNVESGTGIAQALDPTGVNFSERFTADLTYQNKDFAKDWDITLQASYFHLREASELVLYPAGAFGGSFSNGMIGNPQKWERHTRFTASAFYSGFENHRVRLGVGSENADLYRIRESKNFTFTYIPGVGNVPTPLGSVVDVSDTNPFLTPRDRTVNYLYAQDEWNFSKDWYLTAGVRHDRYSDFGGTTNPRLAVVWEANYNLTAKLLAGRAFRAPNFTELYNLNNPVNIGNPNLRPETVRTVEMAFSWQARPGLQLGLNLYRYHMEDIIRLVPNPDPSTGSTAQNTGGQNGRGLELEAAWDASKYLRFSGNYAYQRAIDESTNSDAGYAPHHHLYLRADWRFQADWALHGQLNWVKDRQRAAGDNRPTVANYHTFDLTLRRNLRRDWEVGLTARNLFNAKVFEPSLAPGLITNDLPQAGRAWYVQVRHTL